MVLLRGKQGSAGGGKPVGEKLKRYEDSGAPFGSL
jgi:hypothetical protein